MATTAKTQKDKSYAATPRLMPRPTAASAARAARNATNRNLTLPSSQRQSPSRSSMSPATVKVVKNSTPRCAQRTESKTDVKMNRNSENDFLPFDDVDVSVTGDTGVPMPMAQDTDSFLIEYTAVTVVVVEEELQENADDNGGVIIQEINETDTFEDIITSRPQTPSKISRPQTPRNIRSSRPQTPKMPSRPTTPSPAVQRHTTPASRPNTPQRSTTPTRPRTPCNVPAPCNRIRQDSPTSNFSQPCSIIKDDEDIKTVFTTKQMQFQRMKKELDLKQQAILEVFDCLRELRERMCREGVSGSGEGLQQNDLVVFNVADWATDEVAQLCRDAVASYATDGAVEVINAAVPIDECALDELEAKVTNVPARFADLCLQAFTARQEIIDWVKEFVGPHEEFGREALERIAHYNGQGLNLCESLRELKSRADNVLDTVTQLSKRACRERSALVAVGESLVREMAHLRQDLDARVAIVNEMRDVRAESETVRALEDTRRELEEERAARTATKDKLATTESQLRQTRGRVTKMDRQLRESEASIASLTGTVKILEDQSRQREVQLEARARKLKESLKTGEVASGQLVQQRDALHAEVLDLKEQIETLNTQHKSAIQDLTNQLNESKNALEEQRKKTQKGIELKETAQTALIESQNAIEDLRAKITELENSKPNPDLPTEREMDLWAELQATKDTLRMTEDEVTASKREKVRFLETLTKIAETENKVGMQQKLAAELLSKEEVVGKMQIQIRDLTKNIKLNEQKVIQYEQYVRDLQAHNRAVANCQEAPNGISYQDLQQEIMNLRMGLLEAVHRNEELSELLMQKEQQLEQQDKTSRAQARVIKVREELINMLKNKETEQSRELAALQQDLEHRMKVVDDVNKQIAAKADEIHELFSTLENKQQQIHRLEKIVLALEEQQRRAQAQRTRHEEKIAALEHELAAGGNRRERKFLFF